jgi:hypothetical protein
MIATHGGDFPIGVLILAARTHRPFRPVRDDPAAETAASRRVSPESVPKFGQMQRNTQWNIPAPEWQKRAP